MCVLIPTDIHNVKPLLLIFHLIPVMSAILQCSILGPFMDSLANIIPLSVGTKLTLYADDNSYGPVQTSEQLSRKKPVTESLNLK